jgi:DHA2 family multidrug resistance protein
LGIDFRSLMMWRVYQALSMGFLFVPINTMAFTDMPPSASNQVSAMLNLMRNMGGSIGISAVTTMIVRRSQVHQGFLTAHTYQANPLFQRALSQMVMRFSQRTGEADAMRQAYRAIYMSIGQQAAVLAYIDVIQILAAVCLLGLILLFFAKKNKPGAPAAAH